VDVRRDAQVTGLGFGARLHGLREAAGLSLAQLAERVHFSKGHLSRVESGQKPPSAELARLCDAALGADGTLVRLYLAGTATTTQASTDAEPDHRQTWLLGISPNGAGFFLPSGHSGHPDLTNGIAFGIGRSVAATDDLINAFVARFTAIRQLGQIADPATVLPMVIAETQVLRGLAGGAATDDRAGLWKLASRYAEYAGWMTQEAGDDAMAARWTQWAVRMADLAGDADLRWYALVRRADIALHNDDARSTIEFARQAQSDRAASVRVRGLAAQREAQGHALAGDEAECFRALERSTRLLAEAANAAPDGPPLGTVHTAELDQIILGWCLYELGRPARAAEILDECVARFATQPGRARVKFAVRAALAYTVADELDRAVELTMSLLDNVRAVDSATIRHDLRGLTRALRRRRGYRGVQELQPLLTAALHAPVTLPEDIPTG
jgi:transcriptional regulator with XRE-family HTH domain/tetratricopeptide (TPR) repeat protein